MDGTAITSEEWFARWERMTPKQQHEWIERYRAKAKQRAEESDALKALTDHAQDELGSGFTSEHAATVLRMLGLRPAA